MVTLADSIRAQQRLSAYLSPTPLEQVPDLGENVYIKLECLNLTHSFKIRGALNAMLSLDEAAKARGVIAASSGNHAQGIAYASALAGIPAKILMPSHTPMKKVNGAKQWGAEAVLFGDNYDETEAEALSQARLYGKTYISPYNNAQVIAGASTIGLEIMAQLPKVGRVVVCVGGGGLVSGVGLVVKALRPDCEVIGVNALSAPAMYNRFYQATYAEQWHTLAEALSGDIEPNSLTLEIAPTVVDRMMTVTEAEISHAMAYAVTHLGYLVEGGGAVGLACALQGVLPRDAVPTVIILSGGNVDPQTLIQVLTASQSAGSPTT